VALMEAARKGMGLFVPGRIAEEDSQRLICCVPGCEHPGFPMDQMTAWTRHVKECSRKNEDVISAVIADATSDYFRSPADPEHYEHFRRGGN
jgi:hypothetical protein